MRTSWLALTLVAGLSAGISAPAGAQSDVARQTFTFFGNDLTIVVLDQTAGRLRVIRGSDNRIEVAARAPGGFAGFGLSTSEGRRLRLASTAAYAVDYLVFVPDNVRVQVQTPDKAYPEPMPGAEEVTFRWTAPAQPGAPGGSPGASDGAAAKKP